jgi:hypothetical protein
MIYRVMRLSYLKIGEERRESWFSSSPPLLLCSHGDV